MEAKQWPAARDRLHRKFSTDVTLDITAGQRPSRLAPRASVLGLRLLLQILKEQSVIEQELDSLAAITRDGGIDPDALSGFLEGTQGLPSESLDRLASRDGGIA